MVKRFEKKAVIALSTALLLAFAMVASLIPAIKSEAATAVVNGTIGVTIPPVNSTLNQTTFGNYITSTSTPSVNAYILAANRPPSLDEITEWLFSGHSSPDDYVAPSWGYDLDYSTTVEAGNDYYFVYIFFAEYPFNEDSTVTVNGASDQQFLGVKNVSGPTGEVGLMAGWVKASIPEDPTPDTPTPVTPDTPDVPVTPDTPSADTNTVPTSTNTNIVPATTSEATTSAPAQTTTKATAPKTDDAMPIILIVSIIGAGVLAGAVTVLSTKKN